MIIHHNQAGIIPEIQGWFNIKKKSVNEQCHGDTLLSSQYLGGRGRQISEFQASLVYRVSSRPVGKYRKQNLSWKKNLSR